MWQRTTDQAPSRPQHNQESLQAERSFTSSPFKRTVSQAAAALAEASSKKSQQSAELSDSGRLRAGSSLHTMTGFVVLRVHGTMDRCTYLNRSIGIETRLVLLMIQACMCGHPRLMTIRTLSLVDVLVAPAVCSPSPANTQQGPFQ